MDIDIIEVIKYIFLGILQGLTEPIPVSSSGHLVMARELFGIEARGLSFEIFLNTASLIAVLYIYWKDIFEIAKNFLRYVFKKDRDIEATTDFKYVIYLIIATIPVGVLGFLLKDVIGDNVSIGFVGLMLLVTGTALWFIKNKSGVKRDGELTVKDSIIVGLSQCVALIPGISRSGATLVGSMAVGLEKKNALRFVFLLYIPVSLGTAILSISDIATDPMLDTLLVPYLASFVVTIIATYIGFKLLEGALTSGRLIYFSYYCFAAGIFAIMYQFIVLS